MNRQKESGQVQTQSSTTRPHRSRRPFPQRPAKVTAAHERKLQRAPPGPQSGTSRIREHKVKAERTRGHDSAQQCRHQGMDEPSQQTATDTYACTGAAHNKAHRKHRREQPEASVATAGESVHNSQVSKAVTATVKQSKRRQKQRTHTRSAAHRKVAESKKSQSPQPQHLVHNAQVSKVATVTTPRHARTQTRTDKTELRFERRQALTESSSCWSSRPPTTHTHHHTPRPQRS